MSGVQVNSSSRTSERHDQSTLEGVAATVKLLLKLIQDHNAACTKEKNDGRRMLRVAGMMTILENVRTRIQKCQSFGLKNEAEMRGCNADHKSCNVQSDKRPSEPIIDEKSKLRKELNASLAARKSLEIMCTSLGKEKEIMAAELAKKVQELSGMEELTNDLKVQNETLSEKVKEYAAEHKEKKIGHGGETKANAALLERNKALSEQLLRSLDGYKSLKRKLKGAKEENEAIRAAMEEMEVEVGARVEWIRGFKQQIATRNGQRLDIEREISELENVFECLELKVSKHGKKKGECVKPKGEISASQPSILA